MEQLDRVNLDAHSANQILVCLIAFTEGTFTEGTYEAHINTDGTIVINKDNLHFEIITKKTGNGERAEKVLVNNGKLCAEIVSENISNEYAKLRFQCLPDALMRVIEAHQCLLAQDVEKLYEEVPDSLKSQFAR